MTLNILFFYRPLSEYQSCYSPRALTPRGKYKKAWIFLAWILVKILNLCETSSSPLLLTKKSQSSLSSLAFLLQSKTINSYSCWKCWPSFCLIVNLIENQISPPLDLGNLNVENFGVHWIMLVREEDKRTMSSRFQTIYHFAVYFLN